MNYRTMLAVVAGRINRMTGTNLSPEDVAIDMPLNVILEIYLNEMEDRSRYR